MIVKNDNVDIIIYNDNNDVIKKFKNVKFDIDSFNLNENGATFNIPLKEGWKVDITPLKEKERILQLQRENLRLEKEKIDFAMEVAKEIFNLQKANNDLTKRPIKFISDEEKRNEKIIVKSPAGLNITTTCIVLVIYAICIITFAYLISPNRTYHRIIKPCVNLVIKSE